MMQGFVSYEPSTNFTLAASQSLMFSNREKFRPAL